VGDIVIPNYTTRYFGQALGGRTLFGYDFAPGFAQLGYGAADIPPHPAGLPVPFMAGATPTTVKAGAAAASPAATTPKEGYFQFDQTGIDHGFLLDSSTPANTTAAQTQMLFFLGGPNLGAGPGAGASIVVDPYALPALP
jgi:hypothetical protein